MSVRKTALAAVSLLILAGLVWLDAVHLQRTEMAAFATRTLLAMGLEEIQGVTIDNPHGHFALERRPDGWWLTQPMEVFADQQRVFIILSNMADAKRFTIQEGIPESRLAEYGLDAPTTRATFRSADGRQITLAFGKESPSVQQFFATEVGTGEVFTVSSHVPNNLDKTLLQLRDKRIFPEQPGQTVTAILVTAEGEATRVERAPDGQWEIAGAPPEPADAAVAANLISALDGLQATDFLDGPPTPPQGLAPPRLEVALLSDHAEALHLDVGMPRDIGGENFFARVPGRDGLFTVAGRDIGLLPRRRVDWLDRDLMHLTPDEVNSFTLTVPADQVDANQSFERGEDGTWHLSGDPAARVDQQAVAALLRLFARLTADQIVTAEMGSPEDFGFDRPSLIFVWHGHAGAVTERLELGQAAPGGASQAYYRRGTAPIVYAAPSCFIDVLQQRQQLVNRQMVTADLSAARRILYTRGEVSFDVHLVNGVWTDIDPTGQGDRPLIADRVQSALARLAQARFASSLPADFSDAVRRGLANPPWAVRIEDADGNALADVRATSIPVQAANERSLIVLLDGERAVRADSAQMVELQRWMDQMLSAR